MVQPPKLQISITRMECSFSVNLDPSPDILEVLLAVKKRNK